MNHDRLTVYKNFTFEASHVLPRHPGKCSRLHGHSWKLTVGVSGLVNKESGFVIDYNVLSEAVKAHVINNVDHMHLGQGSLSSSIGVMAAIAPSQKFFPGAVLQTLEDSQPQMTIAASPVFGEDFYPSSEHLVLQFAKILQPVIDEIDTRDWNGLAGDYTAKELAANISQPRPRSMWLEEVSLEETCTCKATWRRGYGSL